MCIPILLLLFYPQYLVSPPVSELKAAQYHSGAWAKDFLRPIQASASEVPLKREVNQQNWRSIAELW